MHIHSFIHSVNEYFLSTSCVSGAVVECVRKCVEQGRPDLSPKNCTLGFREGGSTQLNGMMRVKHLP